MERFQKQAILKDLEKKMVLLAGPRQAGKTTLAKTVAREFKSFVYLNYDSIEDRKILANEAWHPSAELLIFDEIHKMPEWKRYLKGAYDTKAPFQKILVTGSALFPCRIIEASVPQAVNRKKFHKVQRVTGTRQSGAARSARLEVFNQVGDSLAGRYFLHRLMPLSPAECEKMNVPFTLDRFLERGGFPEPFLTPDLIDANRWRLQYVDSLLREDVLDFDNIQNLNAIRMVFELLRSRVGSPVSYSSIAQDVAISPNTVKKYIQILEALYIVFRVTPFSRHIARSLLKEPKIYFFDVALVKGDLGAQFENLVAVCLLKSVFAQVDYQAKRYSLHYLSTKENQEVDFALALDDQIEQIIEVKSSDTSISPSLYYFHEKYHIPAVQVVKELKREQMKNNIEIVQGLTFLKSLYL